MDIKVTIPLEQYEDLVVAQAKLEQLINARNEFYFILSAEAGRVFDAIVSGGC